MVKNLSTAKNGEIGRISSIEGDGRFLNRVTSIGLTLGSTVQVIQNQKKRPLLVYTRDTMIAINPKECEKIMLEVLLN